MNRHLITTLVALSLVLPALAQSSDTIDLTQSTPQENARAGSVSQRAPGNWIQNAIARHEEWIGIRITGPRAGQSAADNQPETEGTTQSTSDSSGSSSGLDALLSQYGVSLDSLASLGSLAGIDVGSLLGGSSSTTTGGSSADDVDPRLAGLLALRDAMAAGNNKTINKTISDSAKLVDTRASSERTFGGGIARLPKPEDRIQDTETERKFVSRLAESWATTAFTVLAAGFQSTTFIEALKDLFRPLIVPSTTDNTDGTDNNNNDNDNNDGTGTGGGIEDLSPDNTGGNNNDSII